MKKKLFVLTILLVILLGIVGCKKTSTFNIRFIDVGQGDAALVECDGHYMLIDGGGKDEVYQELVSKGIQHLDILAISHMHEDHISGLDKALQYATKIDKTISNTDYADIEAFKKLESTLSINGSRIEIPPEGEKYELGSAIVEVISNSSDYKNDSLVLLITYQKTKFLFTGDIEGATERKITQKYNGYNNGEFKVDLIKMPHHGQYTEDLGLFLRTFMPEYAVISVGNNNIYGHPHEQTLSKLSEKGLNAKIYRTDKNGDILVQSDGKKLKINPQK